MRYAIRNKRPAVAATGSILSDSAIVDRLNQQDARIRELETWFQLILGEEPTFTKIAALIPKPGRDATGRPLMVGQTVAAYPRIAGKVKRVSETLVQVLTSAGDVHNIPVGQAVVIDDPSSNRNKPARVLV